MCRCINSRSLVIYYVCPPNTFHFSFSVELTSTIYHLNNGYCSVCIFALLWIGHARKSKSYLHVNAINLCLHSIREVSVREYDSEYVLLYIKKNKYFFRSVLRTYLWLNWCINLMKGESAEGPNILSFVPLYTWCLCVCMYVRASLCVLVMEGCVPTFFFLLYALRF